MLMDERTSSGAFGGSVLETQEGGEERELRSKRSKSGQAG